MADNQRSGATAILRLGFAMTGGFEMPVEDTGIVQGATACMLLQPTMLYKNLVWSVINFIAHLNCDRVMDNVDSSSGVMIRFWLKHESSSWTSVLR
jgi:hypothetical protein